MSGHRKFADIRKDRDDPERQARVAQYRREFQEAISLAELRRARELTQAQLGMALEMPQSAVSRLERQTDLYVSTLRSYVEAMGGQLAVEAVFDNRRLIIGTFSSLADDAEPQQAEYPVLPENNQTSGVVTDSEQRHVRAMGEELGHLYHALWNELVWVNAKWQDFEALYGRSAERIDLLNRVAPHFFWQLGAALWEDVLLHIARITDPPQSVGKDNLTIQRLDRAISEPALAQDVQKLIAAAVSSSTFVRDWRNRRLAHNALGLKLDQGAQPLEPASRRDVRAALDAIGHVLERVHYHYFSEQMVFSQPLVVGGAEALIGYLQRAVQAEDEERERWKRALSGG